jgi:hypothetical protein
MLSFEIDWSGLNRIGEELGATDKQVQFALSRALRRTEATLRRMSTKGLTQVLQLRTMASMRKRLKSIKLRKTGLNAGDSVGLWYGLNSLPVSSFKGRPKKTDGGASFRNQQYDGAFVGRSKIKGKQTIFKRDTAKALPISEQLHEIEDKAVVFIEDEVFDQVETIFWGHFRRDLQSRVKFKIGAY